jgi:hypothetical protein
LPQLRSDDGDLHFYHFGERLVGFRAAGGRDETRIRADDLIGRSLGGAAT